MSISYAATGITQSNTAATGTSTNAAAVRGATSLSFAALSGVSVGQMLDSPAACAGLVVTAVTATSVTLDEGLRADVASGTAIAFVDSDGTLAAGLGLTIADQGNGVSRQRIVTLNGTAPQFTVNGSFAVDARRSAYLITTPTATNLAGFLVTGASARLSISNTLTGHRTGARIAVGSKAVAAVNPNPANETFDGALTVRNGGTFDLVGAGWYGRSAWTLGGLTTVGTINLTDAYVHLGNSNNGLFNTLYNASNNGSQSTINITNSTLNMHLKLLAINPASSFTGMVLHRDGFLAPGYAATDVGILLGTYTAGTTTPNPSSAGMTLVSPRFGLRGQPDTYLNGHIVIGHVSTRTEGPVAVRNVVEGWEQGIDMRVCKAPDFPNTHRPWIERRQTYQLTFLDQSGAAITSGYGTYFEDRNLHTGALQISNVIAQGTGYTDGTYTSNTVGGGTGGTVRITVAAGRVTNAVIASQGSGYTSQAITPINVTVNTTNFPGVGAGSGGSIALFASCRYAAEPLSGCPTVTDNRVYSASVGAAGLLQTTSTNSRNDGTTTAGNPAAPSSTARNGLDLLLSIANCSFTQPSNSFALAPIDTRWAANGGQAFAISFTVRGYLWAETPVNLDYTAFSYDECLAQTVQRTYFVARDAYITATGISEATAAAVAAVTLQAAAPSRGALAAGDTQGALQRIAIGTVTVTGAVTADQLAAKCKHDYTRVTLNTTAGTVARTGFGLAAFLTFSGDTTSAACDVGIWNVNCSTLPSAGTVFAALTSDSTITIAGTLNDSSCLISANTIALTGGGRVTARLQAVTAITGLLTSGLVAAGSNLGFGTGTVIAATGHLSISASELAGTLTINTNTVIDLTLTSCRGSFTLAVTGTGAVRVILAGASARALLPGTLPVNVSVVQALTITGLDPAGLGVTWSLLLITAADYSAANKGNAPSTWAGGNVLTGTGDSTVQYLPPAGSYKVLYRAPGYSAVIGSADLASSSLLTLAPAADVDLAGNALWTQAATSTLYAGFSYHSGSGFVEYSNTGAAAVIVSFLDLYRALETIYKVGSRTWTYVAQIYPNGTKDGLVVPSTHPLLLRMSAASTQACTAACSITTPAGSTAFDRSRANAANAGGYLFSFNPVLTVPPTAIAAIQSGLATATDVLSLAQSVQAIPAPPTVVQIQNGLASQAELEMVGEAVAAVIAQVTALPAAPTVAQIQTGLATAAQVTDVGSDVMWVRANTATAAQVTAVSTAVAALPTPPSVAQIQTGLATAAQVTAVSTAVAALPTPPTVAQIQTGLATSAALSTLSGIINTVQSILVNKTITDPATGLMTIYAADGSTVLLRANVFQDAAGTMPYQGNGAERRERLEAP